MQSDDNDMRLADMQNSAIEAKQPTPERQEDRIVEGKDIELAGSIQIEDAPQQAENLKASREDVYRSRLQDCWAAAHRDSSRAENADERDLFFSIMQRVISDDLAILVDDDEAAPLPTEEISGNVQEIELEIIDRLSANLSQDALINFMRFSIAPTVGRLERAREGTPERRVDVVVRVLFSLRGSSGASKLACELYRYLESQQERDVGFYQTVTNLAIVVSAARPAYLTESMFMYHAVLDGVRRLGEERGLALGETGEDARARRIVNTAAANLAMVIATQVRNAESALEEAAAETIRDLKTVAAVTFSSPSFTSDPRKVAELLDFPANRPVEILSVLIEMAAVADSWMLDKITESRLEATGGVAVAATGNVLRAVDLLFNSGISLRQQRGVKGQRAEDLLVGRMVVDSLGLRLALAGSDNLYESLVGLDGIDCAVNFLAAFVEYRTVSGRLVDLVAAIEPFAAELVHLAKSPLLRRAGRRVDMRRLETSARDLGVTVTERSSFPELAPAAYRTVEALRSALGLGPAEQDDLVVDSAALVARLYGSVLVGPDADALRMRVDDVAAGNQDPMRVLMERYRRYASAGAGDVGRGPALVAGAVTEAEWWTVAARLTDPAVSAVRAISEFAP